MIGRVWGSFVCLFVCVCVCFSYQSWYIVKVKIRVKLSESLQWWWTHCAIFEVEPILWTHFVNPFWGWAHFEVAGCCWCSLPQHQSNGFMSKGLAFSLCLTMQTVVIFFYISWRLFIASKIKMLPLPGANTSVTLAVVISLRQERVKLVNNKWKLCRYLVCWELFLEKWLNALNSTSDQYKKNSGCFWTQQTFSSDLASISSETCLQN